MKSITLFSLRLAAGALLGLGLILTAPLAARAQVAATLQNLAVFNDVGELPGGSLVQGSDGNLYGVTQYGGTYGRGTVFKATPAGAVTTLYSFTGGSDGEAPFGGLVIGGDGNFYGTTSGGGMLPEGPAPSGTIFQLTPTGVLTTLHQFTDTASSGLVQGKDGNFYGVAPAAYAGETGPITVGGLAPGTNAAGDGTDTGGIFFRITPAGDFTTLYNFSNDSGANNSQNPTGRLSLGSDGDFYGVSLGTPTSTVFRITPDGSTLTTVFPFSGAQGTPNDGLVQDQAGNLYGTTFTENSSGSIVFRIDSGGGLTTLHTFNGNDGEGVMSGLTLGSDGNFYGVAAHGGVNSSSNTSTTLGNGTVYQITPAGVLTTLYNFNGEDGESPNGPLLQAGNGLFYGTTADTLGINGAGGYLFALAVSNPPAFFAGELALTNGVYYLQFPNTDFFGYYAFLSDPRYLYHFDLGYEYVFDAKDSQNGVYLYDFASGDFFYTSPTFPFPYLYDFGLKSVLYYYPINFAGRYSSGPRYFYDFSTGQIITK